MDAFFDEYMNAHVLVDAWELLDSRVDILTKTTKAVRDFMQVASHLQGLEAFTPSDRMFVMSHAIHLRRTVDKFVKYYELGGCASIRHHLSRMRCAAQHIADEVISACDQRRPAHLAADSLAVLRQSL